MAAETTKFTHRDFVNLAVRKPTIGNVKGPGETSASTTNTLTIVETVGATPDLTTFTFDYTST